MKHLVIVLLTLLFSGCATAPIAPGDNSAQPEFMIYDNGLIYDVHTMSKLARTVDSLNVRFKTCTPKDYRSLDQGFGTYIVITEKIAQARNALLLNMSLENFLKRFKRAQVKRNLWVVKKYSNYEGEARVEYDSEDGHYEYLHFPDTPEYDKSHGWIWKEFEDEIQIFYLHGLTSTSIPLEYSSLIEYVDCMIDTLATIFPNEKIPDSVAYTLAADSKVKAFLDLAFDFEPEPKKPETGINDAKRMEFYKEYEAAMEKWNMRRMAALDKKMQDPHNVLLLTDAVEESIASQNGMYLDEYAHRYLSPAKSLALKRSWRVYGFCSADLGPRKHALAISKLAAETFQWDIFLRAHLDILNDNFLRNGDGMWAWRMRETYIKELEELRINSVDLLLGTSLHSQDVSDNHYQARTSRIGRAFSESSRKAEVEKRLLTMVMDHRLDLYNRMEMAYVFLSYNQHSKDRQTYMRNLDRIDKAIRSLPHGLYKRYDPLMDG
jgi:hypothetical protein